MFEYEAAIQHYHPTPEDRAWLVYRFGYYGLQLLLLLLIVYRMGPNDAEYPSTYLARPFLSRGRMIAHTLIMLVLATIVSLVVAGFLAAAQLKFIHSGH